MKAVLSAALFGEAQLLPPMWLGGLLIAAASVLEATDPTGDGPTPVAGIPMAPALPTRKESA